MMKLWSLNHAMLATKTARAASSFAGAGMTRGKKYIDCRMMTTVAGDSFVFVAFDGGCIGDSSS